MPNARETALDFLHALTEKKQGLDTLLHELSFTLLEQRDRAFARLMLMTALRRLGQIDDVIARFVPKPIPAKYYEVRNILRLGIAQLCWMDVPAHAGVNEMVELAKKRGHKAHSGMVNAVLKRAAAEGKTVIAAQDEARLAVQSWLWKRWVKHYGEETVRKIAAAQLEEPPLDITPKQDAAHWAKELGGALLASGSVRCVDAGRVEMLPGFADGHWWVQDAAAHLPALLLGDVKGKTIVDMCAAPGGKTAQLAAKGANVIAIDRAEKRLMLLKDNMARLKLNAETITADAAQWKPQGKVDAILLDAPCSATGTLRRHPEIAFGKEEGDITRLSTLQYGLLTHAVSIIGKGGMVVYCVCSLEAEEGEAQIARLLASHPDVSLVPVTPEEIGGLKAAITDKGELRTLPHYLAGGMDGFYAARLIKK